MKYVKLHRYSIPQTENVAVCILDLFLSIVTEVSINQTFLTRSGRKIKSSELLLE